MPENEDNAVDKEIERLEEEEKKIETAEAYFKDMGLNPTIERNDFTPEDAAKVFEKAAKEIREMAETNRKIRSYTKYGWSILQTIIKLT